MIAIQRVARPRTDSRDLWRLFSAGVSVCLISGSATFATAQSAFYKASASEMNGAPGSLIRTEMINPSRNGAVAYRVLYRSVGLRGEPTAVSGTVIVPIGPAPAGGRPIVA